MGTIILVRHGENDWSKNNKLAGRIAGVHLNETGHQQAGRGPTAGRLPINAVYSSPIIRCIETAAYIADTHGLALQQVEGVSESAYGEWEGAKIRRWPKSHCGAPSSFSKPGALPQGEALREVQFRAIQAVEELAARHERK